jgi:hypothetical protein
MTRLQKIAIPTNDGETICAYNGIPRGYLVATIKNNNICKKELRWNKLSHVLTSKDGSFYNLCDCDTFLAAGIEDCICNYLKSLKKQVIITEKSTIQEALSGFLEKK